MMTSHMRLHDRQVKQRLDTLEIAAVPQIDTCRGRRPTKFETTACQSIGRDVFSDGNGASAFQSEVIGEKRLHSYSSEFVNSESCN
jgi:hypothetical protein